MPLPSPKKNRDKKSFISQCMSDPKMKEEFPNNKRRLAVCHSQRKQSKAIYDDGIDWYDWDAFENDGYIFW